MSTRFPAARRAFTLVELLIATVITSMISLSVAGLLSFVGEMSAGQENRVSAVVRVAGVQARVARLALEARMFLEMRPERVALWLPSEMLEGAESGSESNFDIINLEEDEIVWLTWEQQEDGRWRLLEQRPDSDALDLVALEIQNLEVYFTSDGAYWDSVYTWLRDNDALDSSVLAEGIAAPTIAGVVQATPSFKYAAGTNCSARWFAGEYAFQDPEAPINARFDAAIAFPDPHPLCGGSS
ncbi:MAG: prepilin-type N-terminal cleavage/methylation domain-containing protein [Planctomycetota bacterium]|nr:prepilin-type N-terminal cleavage/methylation domain-containing protein [Planctomycetota bacterium]MDA1105649.1 prepilin-type N-terminal cleavage/methylation domain-containing protein [Planctomycetota bacterium]